MGSRESRATPVSGVRQLREHGPKCHGTAWDEPNATASKLAHSKRARTTERHATAGDEGLWNLRTTARNEACVIWSGNAVTVPDPVVFSITSMPRAPRPSG